MAKDNPPVWGNYGTWDEPDWHQECVSISAFFLMMAVYSGTLGGLKFNANRLLSLTPEVVETIQKKWKEVPEISWEKQKVYTRNFEDAISLMFDNTAKCTGILAGTNSERAFEEILALNIDWSYTSE